MGNSGTIEPTALFVKRVSNVKEYFILGAILSVHSLKCILKQKQL